MVPAVVAAARWFANLSSTFLRLQRQVPTIQNIQKTVEFPCFDKDNVFALAFVLSWVGGIFPMGRSTQTSRASDLMIVGESVRSLLFVIMLTLLVTGRFSR